MSLQKQMIVSTKNHSRFDVRIEEYNSAFEVAEDCKTRKITSGGFRDVRDSDNYGGEDSWNGCASYDEALDLLKNGYIKQVEKIKQEIAKTVHGQSKRIKFDNDIVGYAPIVPLAILGVPNSMINSTMKPIKAKVLDVYYDMTCSCATDSKDIIDVGIEFLKTIASMEMQGYRIKLTAIQSYTNSSYATILKVNLKSANQPLDLKRVSFPTMHTAFFRVIGFDWYSKTPHGVYLNGYGHNIKHEFDDKEEFTDLKTKLFGNNVVYVAAKDLIKFTRSKDKIAEEIRRVIDNECKINNA